jgi:hypothetical protein
MGVITGDKSYFLGTEKIGYKKSWENDTEFWEKKALPLLEQTLKEKVCYGSSGGAVAEAIDKLIEDSEIEDKEKN